MWKKFRAGLAALKQERINRARQAARFARLEIEILEVRLTPASVPVAPAAPPIVAWKAAPEAGGTTVWNVPKNWVQNTKPAAGDNAFFNQGYSAPVLSVDETVGQLTMRGGGNGPGLNGAYKTLLDLKGQILVATNETQVLSAAGVRVGNAPPTIQAGLAPETTLEIASTGSLGALTTGKITVGYNGLTITSGGNPTNAQNRTTLSIDKNVTVNVKKGATAGDVLVGGATVGNISLQAGSVLNARNLSIGGVGLRLQSLGRTLTVRSSSRVASQ